MIKLDKKTVDQLIQEVLTEVAQLPADGYKVSGDLPYVVGKADTQQKHLDALKNIETPEDVLNNADLKELIDNPENITFDHIQAIRGLIRGFRAGFGPKKNPKYTPDSPEGIEAKAAIDALLAVEDAYGSYIQSFKQPETSVTDPAFASGRAELPASGGTAPFPAEQLAIVQRAMEGIDTGDFEGRVERLSEISTLLYEVSIDNNTAIEKLKAKPVSQSLNDIMLADLFNYIVKDMDAGSGGYLFEYFLSLLYEGRGAGKETTAAGKMAATDFVTKEGGRGSAKYYSQKGAISQSPKGFPVGESMSYVIAIKKEDESQIGQKGSVSKADPARLVAVDIYVFDVTRENEILFTSKGIDVETNKAGELKLGKLVGENSFVGTIRLCASPTSSFEDVLNAAMENAEIELQNAFIAMKDIFESLNLAKTGVKQYISTGTLELGNKAFTEMAEAEEEFRELVQELSTDEGYGKLDMSPTSRIVAKESKLQALDELILEVLKNNS
jgi:hypothetical protein